MSYNGAPYGVKVGWIQGISTENMTYGPQKYGIWTPPLYAIWTVFIGGGLQFVEQIFKPT